jgi:hypothetical protein
MTILKRYDKLSRNMRSEIAEKYEQAQNKVLRIDRIRTDVRLTASEYILLDNLITEQEEVLKLQTT